MSFLPAPTRQYEVYRDDASSMPPPPPRPPAAASTALSTRPATSTALSAGVIAVTADESGSLRFDGAILAQHRGRALVHTRFSDLMPHEASAVVVPRPSAEEEAAATARTRAALDGVVNSAITAARSGAQAAAAAASAAGADNARIIRYTPDESAPGFNPAARVRMIKMIEAAIDPMEPARFKHKKLPAGPPEAPVPIMHSPSRKVTAEDAAAWKIPPCISNYKNPRGYVIPLDKRIAADGRTLIEPAISDNFAKLSESLLIAERKARVEVETRAAIQRRLAARAKEEKEAELRALAGRARLERGGVAGAAGAYAAGEGGGAWAAAVDFEGGGGGGDAPPPRGGGYAQHEALDEDFSGGRAGAGAGARAAEEGAPPPRPRAEGESAEDYTARLERDRARREFRLEREREMRLEAAAGARRGGMASRDAERDVSERVALGQMMPTGAKGAGGEGALYDARLFNQGEGVKSGFADDEDYEAYDKAWRGGAGGEGAVASIYRPRTGGAGAALSDAAATASIDALTQGAAKRFRADGEGGARDFEGGALHAPARTGPVEFERTGVSAALRPPTGDGGSGGGGGAADPFGLDAFLGAGPPRPNALSGIGKGGFMAAVGGGAARSAAELGAGSGRNIAFVSAGYTGGQ